MNQHDTTANLNYERALRKVLFENWDLDQALELSDKLHDHECAGRDLSSTVETLWERLTAKIEAARAQEPIKG